MRFADKVALVTGASRGIGRAIALRFASEGAQVVVNYRRSAEQAEEVVKEAERLGSAAVAVQADMGNTSDIQALFQQVRERFGCLDFLVFNAAATSFRPLLRQGEHNIDRTFGLTVKGLSLIHI